MATIIGHFIPCILFPFSIPSPSFLPSITSIEPTLWQGLVVLTLVEKRVQFDQLIYDWLSFAIGYRLGGYYEGEN
jgi:hypothetical protein